MPPKRALFSINVDSEADHIYQRVNDRSKPGAKVVENLGPSVGHTDFQFVKPIEKLVDRTIAGVEEGSGKKVHSAEGEVSYSSCRSSTKTVKNESRGKRQVERYYDTSDL